MDEPRFPWQAAYVEALTELDPVRLSMKIRDVEIAIAARLVQHPDPEEMEALRDALRNLRLLLNRESKKADVA